MGAGLLAQQLQGGRHGRRRPADGSAWESSCSFRNLYFSGLRMVQRGGSALAPAFGYARALVRHHAPPKWRGDDRGFRLARDPHP